MRETRAALAEAVALLREDWKSRHGELPPPLPVPPRDRLSPVLDVLPSLAAGACVAAAVLFAVRGVAGAEGQVKALQEQVEALSSAVAEARTELESLRGERQQREKLHDPAPRRGSRP
jgi:hypothetical protein